MKYKVTKNMHFPKIRVRYDPVFFKRPENKDLNSKTGMKMDVKLENRHKARH